MPPTDKPLTSPIQRIRFWYVLLLIVFGIFIVRLFYIQIIRFSHYETAALRGQLKEYEIPAERGVIEAHNGEGFVPIVLNEVKYTLFADPKFVENSGEAATKVQGIIGGDASEYERLMKANSRYVVLAKKLNKDKKEAVDKLELKGVGTREALYRTYPQGSLGAQILGFVNDEGQGSYGLEQALNEELSGEPGQLKAITDASGVPLAANKDNIVTEPQKGNRLVLTIDVGMQQQLEDILKAGLERAKSESGGAVILDPKTGAIKAMANYPTFNPAEFYNVKSEDSSVFQNNIVSGALEVGSVMKPLTMAAALNEGTISKDQTYYDPGSFKIDGYTITNVEEAGGPGPRAMRDILKQSLNTGATWMLMQMGGGEINQKARQTWHDYMVNHYGFGKTTGVEQGYESEGSIPDPNEGFGLNLQFANSAFGQGMTATPIQMAAAISAVLNGGNYYQPHLVEKVIGADGKETTRSPKLVRQNVVKTETSQTIKEFMEYVFSSNHRVYGMPNLRPQYLIGAKTGTAQIPKPGGGYYDDRFNGMFIGFVGGNEVEYVVVVRVNEPKVPGYAGSRGAGPIFSDLANMLIDNFGVTPKS